MIVASIATRPVVSMTAMSTGPRSERNPTPGPTVVPGSPLRARARPTSADSATDVGRNSRSGSGTSPPAGPHQEHAGPGDADPDDQHGPGDGAQGRELGADPAGHV